MRVLLALALAGLLAVSGCLDGNKGEDDAGTAPGPGAAPNPFEAARLLMDGVPCEAEVGAPTSENLRELAEITFEEGGVGDIDVRGDLLATTRSLHDISDPLAPVQVADFQTLEIHGSGDVKFLPDNRTLVTGTNGGILLIDVRDPRAPVVEDEWSFDEFTGVNLPGGSVFLNAHMLGAARIAGEDWVFLAPNSNSGIWILRVDGEPGSRQLAYVAQTLPAEGGPLGPHDMFVHQDPFTEQWLLYSADGFHGWTVFDLQDPTAPSPIGGLVLPQPGYTHTIQATRLGEQRIVVTIAEVGENLLQVFDATILQAPVLLATWQVEPLATTPQHNLNLVEGYLYLAHYGYGMYVFELDDAGSVPVLGAAAFQPVAHYDPVPGGTPYVAGIGGFEAVYDVVLQDGLLYVSGFSDPVEGVVVLGFGCIAPGDEVHRSVG
jgi:hypothetical protein